MKRVIVCLSIVGASACGDSDSSAEPRLYHLPDPANALSLEIRSQGTFRWHYSGCDSFGGDEGLWRSSDEGMVLVPAAGETTFLWPMGPGVQDVDRLDVSPDAGDEGLLVTGVGEYEPEPQRWTVGGVCAICGSSPDPTMLQLGPTAIEPCEDPFP